MKKPTQCDFSLHSGAGGGGNSCKRDIMGDAGKRGLRATLENRRSRFKFPHHALVFITLGNSLASSIRVSLPSESQCGIQCWTWKWVSEIIWISALSGSSQKALGLIFSLSLTCLYASTKGKMGRKETHVHYPDPLKKRWDDN